ncbi:MAG TPA: YIP1 family protein [Pyrinomonadaceae bacterium]|jgi:hypothetical protein|nr:YIP1 family protein [Pyrinomonadaceae bacterium]
MSESNMMSPPHAGEADGPTMSTAETLTGIFFEPGRTFEALRARPRFLIAVIILIALALVVTVLLMQKVDFVEFITKQITSGPRSEQMTPEAKAAAIGFWTGPIGKVVIYVIPPVFIAIAIAAGAAIYLLAAMLMGGKMSYKQALSVWVYSSFPPGVLQTVLSVVILFMKSAEDIDLNKSGGGLVVTSLAALVNPSSPALRGALSWFDLFTFYGMYLAALGLRKVGKLSSGSAWTIVIALWVIGVLWSAGRGALFG